MEFTSVKDSADFALGTMAFPGARPGEGLTSQLWGVPTQALAN